MNGWRLMLTADLVDKHRSNEALHELLALARILNSLRFAQAAAIAPGHSEAPHANRQRQAAFLYTCGILAEALIFMDRLGKHFRGLESYSSFIGIKEDPAVKELRKDYLSPLRNEAVFHNDRQVFSGGLHQTRMKEYTLAEGASERQGDAHYPLADNLVVSYLIAQKVSDSDAFYTELERVLEVTNKLVLDLCMAGDTLIGEAIRSMGEVRLESAATADESAA